jgi:hypothetical protein
VKKLTVLLAVAVFIATLVGHAPATLLPAMARLASVDLAALDVKGSLWRGEISSLQVSDGNQHYYIDNFAWQLHPMSLLAGQVCLDILDARAEGISVRGNVCANSAGDVQGENLTVITRVRNALRLANFPLPVDGQSTLSISTLDWSSEAGFKVLTGEADIREYAYQVAGRQEVLGDYRLSLAAPDPATLLVKFLPSDAKILLQGHVSVSMQGAYDADLQFIPGPEAGQALVDSLKFLAVAKDDGTYTFKYSGRL